MRNLIRRILKEETVDLFYNDSIINKPNYDGLDKTTNFNTYNVFVSGIESSWDHTIQRNEFDKEYTSNLPLKQFRYRSSSDWDKNIKPLFIKEIKALFGNIYPNNLEYKKFRNFYLFYLGVYLILFLLFLKFNNN